MITVFFISESCFFKKIQHFVVESYFVSSLNVESVFYPAVYYLIKHSDGPFPVGEEIVIRDPQISYQSEFPLMEVIYGVLDIFDYISNNILMPVVAISTCILIGWIVKPKTIIDEATKNGERFGRKGMYIVMVKFIEPVLLFLLLLGSLGVWNKLLG